MFSSAMRASVNAPKDKCPKSKQSRISNNFNFLDANQWKISQPKN